MQKIGDFLLMFQEPKSLYPSRSASSWHETGMFGSARLCMTDADQAWNGFPCASFEDAQYRTWLLGESYGSASIPQVLEDPGKLNGHCLLLTFEMAAHRWHLFTNRLGTLHAFYAWDGKRGALGTFSPAVASAANKSLLDWQALGHFFRLGFFTGGSTYWQGLSLVRPATHLVLDAHGRVLSEEQTWQWHHDPQTALTYDQAVVEFHDLFEQVLREQAQGKRLALPISGGLDSRCTVAVLGEREMDTSQNLYPFSYGYEQASQELKIASRVARSRGLALQKWTIPPYLFDQLDRVTASVEGFQDITQCRQAGVVDALGQNADYVLAAHWGDVWLDDMGFLDGDDSLPQDTLASKMAQKFTKKGSADLLKLFAHQLPTDAESSLVEQIGEDLKTLSDIEEVDFKVKAWKTQEWSHRWTLASLKMYQAGLFPVLPFYDQRLVDFFCRVPSQYVAGRRLQIDYLKRYAPDLAKITWQKFDANLYNYQHFNTWLLPKRALKKAWRLLTNQKVIQRNWEVQFLNPQGRAGLQRWLLQDGLKLHDLLRVADVRALLEDLYREPTAGRGYAVSMLLTFSAWLEHYG